MDRIRPLSFPVMYSFSRLGRDSDYWILTGFNGAGLLLPSAYLLSTIKYNILWPVQLEITLVLLTISWIILVIYHKKKRRPGEIIIDADRLTVFVRNRFFWFPKKKYTLMLGDIAKYKLDHLRRRYVTALMMKLKNGNSFFLDFAEGSPRLNAIEEPKFDDDFVFALESFVANHPELCPAETIGLFKEDDWGWVHIYANF